MINRKIFSILKKEMKTDKVIVLTGMRRVGKTTLIRLLYEGLSGKRKLYLDLENPVNQQYFDEPDFDRIKLYFDDLASGREKDLAVFLDEIQQVKNAPSVVKYLYDHYKIKFVLTGSASFYLKNLFTESLAGRKRLFELYPLDFEEFLSFKAPQIKKPNLTDTISKPIFNRLTTYYHEFLHYGGFPSVVVKNNHDEKMAEIGDIFGSYFQKEVQLLSDFRKLTTIRSTMLLLLHRVGSKLDSVKIAAELGVSRLTIADYLDFLEGTYFLFRIQPFSSRLDVSLRGQAKPYICDNGFLKSVNDIWEPVLVENSVFQLLRGTGTVFYYQSKGGAEIDFVVKNRNSLTAFEVKSHASITDVNKLRRLSQKLGIDNFYVVSQTFVPEASVIYPFQL